MIFGVGERLGGGGRGYDVINNRSGQDDLEGTVCVNCCNVCVLREGLG